MGYRAVALLDRDGTIIVNKPYLNDPNGVELALGSIEGMKLLRDAGFALVLVTNQSGIARGLISEAALATIHARLDALMAAEGLFFSAVEYCPHAPWEGCRCRKPAPGMILSAMAKLDIPASCAVLIGDSDADIGAAKAAGVRAIRINADGGETGEAAADFLQAARRALALFSG